MAININNLFKLATKNKASDLHIIVGKPPILRVDGELKIIPDVEIVTREL
ncbi:MAG: Type pili twitching motility protein PilT, partial [Patescibacteria group bacterium]|nr:Type pili twitching motility protein PilT [Patescibacteria group bacterium]